MHANIVSVKFTQKKFIYFFLVMSSILTNKNFDVSVFLKRKLTLPYRLLHTVSTSWMGILLTQCIFSLHCLIRFSRSPVYNPWWQALSIQRTLLLYSGIQTILYLGLICSCYVSWHFSCRYNLSLRYFY